MHIRKKSERGSEKQYMVDGKEIPMVCSIRSPGLELCTPECHCYGKWEICCRGVGEGTLYSSLAQSTVTLRYSRRGF